MPSNDSAETLTGRCYCGACRISAGAVLTVSYCHCENCRRWTGAPVAAFAAVSPEWLCLPKTAAHYDSGFGVERWFCPDCGGPLAASFDYLLDQVYLSIGILDQAAVLAPRLHSHTNAKLPWLHIDDALPREARSARDSLAGNR